MRKARTQEKDYSTEDLLKAIDGSKGNMSTIAERLGCSWATARKYISFDSVARSHYEGETEKMLDTAERIIGDSLESVDSKVRLETAKWLLAVKGKGRGYGAGGGNVLLEKPLEERLADMFS